MPLRESLDAVEAYNRIAPAYAAIADRRRAYLRSIEELIVSRIRPGSQSLLDVGGGDGRRAVAIAQRTGIRDVVLLEPSAAMRARVPAGVEVWPIRAEEIPPTERRFDMITCLWNVLGHISREARVLALSNIAALVNPDGRILLDVNHRYNAREYGRLRTTARWIYDHCSPDDRHGDVTVRWDVDGAACSSYGHVFTDREFRRLAGSTGLGVTERIVVDYATGRTRRFAWEGNLLYVLRRQDSTASANVSRT